MDDVSSGAELCDEAALALHKVDPNNDLLRFFVKPSSEDEWIKVRNEFTVRFGKEGFQGEKCKGHNALSYFYAKFFVALREECKKHNVEV